MQSRIHVVMFFLCVCLLYCNNYNSYLCVYIHVLLLYTTNKKKVVPRRTILRCIYLLSSLLCNAHQLKYVRVCVCVCVVYTLNNNRFHKCTSVFTIDDVISVNVICTQHAVYCEHS